MTTPPHPPGEWRSGPSGETLWVPEAQPPGPDGRRGVWAWDAVDGSTGEWRWYAAPPALATSPAPARPRPQAGQAVRRPAALFAGAGALLGLALLVLNLAGSHDAPAARTGDAPAGTISDGERTERLLTAANSYARAVAEGDTDAVAAVLDPGLCDDTERGDALQRAAAAAAGRTPVPAKVRSVAVDGDRGLGLDWEMPADAPAQVRDLAAAPPAKAQWPWRWHDGKWWYAGGCVDDSTEPEPAS